MSKSIKIYIGILVLLFLAIVAVEFSRPRPINWTRTFNETQKIPFGTYIFHEELSSVFPEAELIDLAETPYEFFGDQYNWADEMYEISGTYIYIDESMTIDEISAQELLDFASYGNTVFISSLSLPATFKDSLHFETKYKYDMLGDASFSFANRRLENDSITFDRGISNVYFSELDAETTNVLGYQNFSEDREINFVEIAYGEGKVLLHLQPVVFTNYTLLKKNNQRYAAALLRYLSEDTFFFDSRNKKRNQLSNNKLRFIFSQPALKWAWLLAVISLLIFVVFNAKRKQRIIKVIPPVKNTTVAFTKTIGNLYYETKDHKNLIDKKITYFLEYIRRTYYLDTQVLDDKFVKNLSQKSGRDRDLIKRMIKLIAHLKAKSTPQEGDLITLNRVIETFFLNN